MLWSKCIATNNNENESKHNVMLNVCTYKSGTSESSIEQLGAPMPRPLALAPASLSLRRPRELRRGRRVFI